MSRDTGRRGSGPSTSVGCVAPVRAQPAPVRGELGEPQSVSNEAARAIRNARLFPVPSLLVNPPGACRRAGPEPVKGESPSNHTRLSLAASRTPQSLPALPAMPPTHALLALLPLTSSPTFAVPGPASPLPSIHQPLASSPASSWRLQPGPSSTQQAEPTPAFLLSLSNHTPFTPASRARHPPPSAPAPSRAARRYPPPTCHLPPDSVHYLCKPRNRIPDARRLLCPDTVSRSCRHSWSACRITPGPAGIPSSPSFRICRHSPEPLTHSPGRTLQDQLSTRPESAPQNPPKLAPRQPEPPQGVRAAGARVPPQTPATTHLPFPRPPRARPRQAEGACPELAEGASTPRTSPPDPAKKHPRGDSRVFSKKLLLRARHPAAPCPRRVG